MKRNRLLLLLVGAIFLALLLASYFDPTWAPEGWFDQRTEEKVRDR